MPYTQDGRPIRVDTVLPTLDTGSDPLLLENFTADESVSKPFSLQLTMLSESSSLDFNTLVQSPVTVTLELSETGKRYFHGLVREVEQGETRLDLTTYTAEVVPWLWFLRLSSNCRVFTQGLNAKQILEDVFKRNNFDWFEFSLVNEEDLKPREYCVQYRETDFDFVSRIMEEEGLFYYFRHEENKHTLVIADDNARLAPVTDPDVRYHQPDAGVEDANVVTHLNLGQAVATATVSLSDYDFVKPDFKLQVQQSQGAYERYDYPGVYTETGDGQRLAKLRLQGYQCYKNRVTGSGTHREFGAGSTFDLVDHPRTDANQKYALLWVAHTMGPNGYRTGDNNGAVYTNHFEAMPFSLQYRTLPSHPKPFVRGVQTAVVVGSDGEFEADSYGRVKVQFFWDREGEMDGRNSCWVRVSQSWAGKDWGAINLPRIGQEVIVDFLEGDPDRPIITGRVYNGTQTPPYSLNDAQTRTVFKTNSSPGGGGFNEIRLEDAKGREQIFIHAERDHETRVKNDLAETVLGEFHQHIAKAQFIGVDKDRNETVGGDHNEKVTGTISRQAGQDVQEKAGGSYAMDAASEIHLKAGMTVVIEAETSLTLKVGGNFININPAGVSISGTMVMINSGGSAGSGSGSSPQSPQSPRDAVDASAGESDDPASKPPPLRPATLSPAAQALVNAQKSAAPYCEVCSRGQ